MFLEAEEYTSHSAVRCLLEWARKKKNREENTDKATQRLKHTETLKARILRQLLAGYHKVNRRYLNKLNHGS